MDNNVLSAVNETIRNRLDLRADDVTLLHFFGYLADATGAFSISVSELAGLAGLCDRGVQGAVARLEKLRLVDVTRRKILKNQNQKNRYRLVLTGEPGPRLSEQVLGSYQLVVRELPNLIARHDSSDSKCADRVVCALALALASSVDYEAKIRQSLAQLAQLTRYSRRSVRYGIAALVRAGAINSLASQGSDRSREANEISLGPLFDRAALPLPANVVVTGDPSKPMASGAPPMANGAPPMANNAPPMASGAPTSAAIMGAPVAAPVATSAPKSPIEKQKAKPTLFPEAFFPEKLVCLWNVICAPHGCARAHRLDWRQISNIKARYLSSQFLPPGSRRIICTISEWAEFFEYLATSRLFCGIATGVRYPDTALSNLSLPRLFSSEETYWNIRSGKYHEQYGVAQRPALSTPEFDQSVLVGYSPVRASKARP